MDARNEEGKTALELAEDPEIQEVLKEALAKQHVLTVTARSDQEDDLLVTCATMTGHELEARVRSSASVGDLKSAVADRVLALSRFN